MPCSDICIRRGLPSAYLFYVDDRQLGTVEDTRYRYHIEIPREFAADYLSSAAIGALSCREFGEYALVGSIQSLLEHVWQSPLSAVSVSRQHKVKALPAVISALKGDITELLRLVREEDIIRVGRYRLIAPSDLRTVPVECADVDYAMYAHLLPVHRYIGMPSSSTAE